MGLKLDIFWSLLRRLILSDNPLNCVARHGHKGASPVLTLVIYARQNETAVNVSSEWAKKARRSLRLFRSVYVFHEGNLSGYQILFRPQSQVHLFKWLGNIWHQDLSSIIINFHGQFHYFPWKDFKIGVTKGWEGCMHGLNGVVTSTLTAQHLDRPTAILITYPSFLRPPSRYPRFKARQ